MADEQIVTSIVAKADLTSLVSEVHRATASLQTLQRELLTANKSIASAGKVANNLFRDTLVGSGLYSSHFVNLNSDVDKFGKNLDAGRLKLKDYFNVFNQHAKTSTGLIRELAREQVMMQNAILQPLGRNAQGLMQFNALIPRGLDEVRSKTQLARMEMQIMNRALSEGATSLINWGKNTQWAGRQLTVGLTVPLTMFGTAAAKAFREADQELVRLTKVYGGLAATSKEELAKVRKDVTDTAKTLASSYGATFKETLGLAADIAATGKTGNELLGSIKETTRLAILGEVDRQEAMKATLAIQTAFKQNTEELTQSIDFLNAVENQTSTTLADLVEAIPKAGPIIKGLGGSVKDLALYLTAMREGGISASEGANALKSGLASLINPTKVAQEKFKSFGIDILGIVNSNAGNVTGTLLSLQSALDKLNPLQKQQALEQLFGKFQFARMNALFENLGKQGSQTLQVLDLMKASTKELADVASRELSMVTESASGKYRRALEKFKADLAGGGDRFLELGTKILTVFDKIINFFTKLPEPVKKILTYLAGFTAVIGPIIMLTGVLANFFGYITKGIVSMRAFFMGARGWKMLTPEMIATQKAAQLVEKGFYSDAEAATVLHSALQKLIADYSSLKAAASKGSIPVNPAISSATSGGLIMAGNMRRVVDPADIYAGETNTRAIAHMNPRDINNPATIMGGVPAAIPVNQKIRANPQIYMHERLPNIEGLTSFGGVSSGIVAGEAARFHALMATLGMQTEAEVAALKKTISLGGTVSNELLQTFDDILPLTTRIADNAAAQSAAIVAELRAGKISIAAARSRIIALNAQIEQQLIAETALFAQARGRTIDFTKAPLMQQPVVDRNAQFTLRDLYKKESNRGVMEEFGRLRGIRTFGAPYTIQSTRFPRFNQGGSPESFGPNKTVVSGDTSINYDDRLGNVPLGGYVLNQDASMDPANAKLVAQAPRTFSGGGNITAALTPGEVVFGPKIQQDPALYAAVEAANNGYSFGGQIVRSIGNYGEWDRYKSRIGIMERYHSSPNWEQEVRFRMIMNSAGGLVSMGISPEDAIKMAQQDVESVFDKSKTKDGTSINRDKFKANARDITKKRHNYILKQYGKSLLSKNPHGANALHAGQINADSLKLLQQLSKIEQYSSIAPRVYDRLFLDGWDDIKKLQGRNMFVSEHISPADRGGRTNWGYNARSNYLQAMAGEENLNWWHDKLAAKNQWINAVALSNKQAGSLTRQGLRSIGLSSMEQALASLTRGISSAPFLRFRSPFMRLSPVLRAANKGGPMPGGRINSAKSNYGISLLSPEKMLRILKTSKELSSNSALGKFAGMEPAAYSHQIAPSSGKSYPIPGVSGIYRNDKGELVFFKGVPNEISAKAEMYGTRMAREVFGLDSPVQTPRTVLNPFDPSGKSKLLGLESPFNPKFGKGGTKFTEDQMIRQTIASLLMGNKDLSASNVFGNILADVGPAGVFSRASMNTEFSKSMNSMEKQAMINLLAVRGGARKDFAYNTSSIAAGMSPRQYGSKMKSAMKSMHPKLKDFIKSLPKEDQAPYLAMLGRLEDGMNVNWSKYQSIHANPAFNRGGGIVRSGRSAYGRPGNPAAAAAWDAKQREKRARELEAQRSRAASHQIYGQQALTTGLGREATRQGTTSFYNPISAMYSNLLNTIAPITHRLRLAALEMRQIPMHLNAIARDVQRAAIQMGKGGTLFIKHMGVMANSMRSYVTDLGRAVSAPIMAQARHMKRLATADFARMGYFNATPGMLPPHLAAQAGAANRLQRYIGPVGLTAWSPQMTQTVGEDGKVSSAQRMHNGKEVVSRQTGPLGFRQEQFGVKDANGNITRLSAQEARAAGLSRGFAARVGGRMANINPMGGSGMAMGMAGMAAGSGLMAAGHTGLGMAAMIGLPMLPMAMPAIGKGIAGMSGSLSKVSTAFKAGAAQGNVFTGVLNVMRKVLSRALFVGPIAGIMLLVAAIGVLIKKSREWNKDAQLRFGLNEKAAKQAGIQWTSLADKIKLVQQRQAALQNIGKGGIAVGGITGLNMSIKELQKYKDYAKNNLSEFLGSFDRADAGNIAELAANIKAQFVGAGMSVEEANKKIMGLVAASKNSSLAIKVLTDSQFRSISDGSDAASYAFKHLQEVIKNGGGGFDQYKTKVIEGMNSVIDLNDRAVASIAKQKTATGEIKGEYNALLEVMQRMKTSGNGDPIGAQAFEALPDELKAIALEADSIAGIYAKWRLLVKGVQVDFKNLTSDTAEALDKYLTAFTAAQDNLVKEGEKAFKSKLGVDQLDGTFKKIGFTMAKLQEIIDRTSREAIVAQQKAAQAADDQNKKLQEQIDLIREAANEKLKALDATAARDSYEAEIAKKKLDYQEAIAKGDFAAAERARIDLSQAQKAYNIEQARLAIQEKAAAEEKALQAKQKAIADQQAIDQRKFQDAQNEAARAQEAQAKIANYTQQYKDLLLQKQTNEFISDSALKNTAQINTTNALKGLITEIQNAATVKKGEKGYDIAADIKSAFGKFFDAKGNKLEFDSSSFVPTYGTTGLELRQKFTKGAMGDVINRDFELVQSQVKGITGGMTIKALADRIRDDAIKVAKGDYNTTTTSADVLKITANSPGNAIYQANKAAAEGRTKVYQAPDDPYKWSIFEYKGKQYATNQVSGVVAEWDSKNNKPGKAVDINKMATGGFVSGPGTGTSDSIPAMLSNGEYVINAASAANIGYDNLDRLNRMKDGGRVGELQKFGTGGKAEFKDIFGMNIQTGTRSAMLKIAEKAVGYIEKATNNPVARAISNTISKALPKFDLWCGKFVNWVASLAGVKIPNVTGTAAGYSSFRSQNRLFQTPQPGDLAFFDFGRNKNITDHVGLVSSIVGKNIIRTIEGNTSGGNQTNGGMVAIKQRRFGAYNPSAGIFTRGFGRPSYKDEIKEFNQPTATNTDIAPHFLANADSYNVKRGDNLFSIARQFKISLGSLLRANPELLNNARYAGGARLWKGTDIRIPRFATGGTVGNPPRRMMASAGPVTGNVTMGDIVINAAPGMDERMLAKMAAEEVFAVITNKKLQMGPGKMAELNRMVI